MKTVQIPGCLLLYDLALEKLTVHVAVAHRFQRFGQSALNFKHFKGRTDPEQQRAAWMYGTVTSTHIKGLIKECRKHRNWTEEPLIDTLDSVVSQLVGFVAICSSCQPVAVPCVLQCCSLQEHVQMMRAHVQLKRHSGIFWILFERDTEQEQ